MTSRTIRTFLTYSSLDELERCPGPSQDPTASRSKVLDILLVKYSDSYGRQVAVSCTKGFYWAALGVIQRTAPDIWQNYVKWYDGEHNSHPLEALRHTSDSSASDSDEPRALLSNLTVEPEVRFLASMVLKKSVNSRHQFLKAPAAVREEVGAFFYFKHALVRWRDFLYFQNRRQDVRSHWNSKQLVACLSKLRSTVLSAVTDARRAHQIEVSRKSRWFKKMLLVTDNIQVAKTSLRLSVATALKKTMISWKHDTVITSKSSLQGVASMQQFKVRQFQIHFPIWRLYIETKMQITVRPMRTAFYSWHLSAKLSAKLKLYDRWTLRTFFSRWFNGNRIAVNRHRKQTYLQNWILVQRQKSSAVIQTTTAYMHQHDSLLSQSWNLWLSQHKHSLLTTGFLSQAYQHQLGTLFDRWVDESILHSKLSRQTTLTRLQAVIHFNLKVYAKAWELWRISYDLTLALSRAISYKNKVSTRTSFESWLSDSRTSYRLTRLSTLWLSMAPSHARCKSRSLQSWHSWARNRRSKLELLEEKVHTTNSLQWVHANLESKSLEKLWTPIQIAVSFRFYKSLEGIKRTWSIWHKLKAGNQNHDDRRVYQRILRNAPDNPSKWLDQPVLMKFLSKLKSRLIGTRNTASEQRAKRRAIYFVLMSKNLAHKLYAFFHRWDKACSQQQNEAGSQSEAETISDTDSDSDDHFLSPPTSDAWKSLKNITQVRHDSVIPKGHIAAPVAAWNKKLSKNISVVNQYSKLQVPGSTLSQVTAGRIPTISEEDVDKLTTPFKLWSSSLDEQEHDMADQAEIMISYTFVWCLPLWFDRIDGEHTLVLWNCCDNNLTCIPGDRCLPDIDASDDDVSRLFITFQGESFAVPYSELGSIDNLTTPLTIQGLSAAEASSVPHITTPQSVPESNKPVNNESTTDAELLKTANRENAALLRSPFLTKDKQEELPTPAHVASKTRPMPTGPVQVSVMQVIRHATSETLGTVHEIDKNDMITVRWDNNSDLSKVSLSDITLLPALGSPAEAPSTLDKNTPVESETTTVDTSICYNPACNYTFKPGEHSCENCNFPRDRLSFYCSNNHLTDPAKKWCQTKGCGAVNIHFLSLSEQADHRTRQVKREENTSEVAIKLFPNRHSTLRTKLQFRKEDFKVFLLLRSGQTEKDLRWSRTLSADQYLCRMIDTEVGPIHRKANNMNKFRIVHTWRLYYKTCNTRIGGNKDFGLHAIEFDEQLNDESSMDVMTSFDFSGAVVIDKPKDSKFTDINHWVRCHQSMNEWLGWHLQSTWQMELQAIIAYIRQCYMDNYLLSINIDVDFCEEVVKAVHQAFTNELRMFVSDKEQHAAHFPDTIWVFPGHQFTRPKLWIESNGVERDSFKLLFRGVRKLKEKQKIRITMQEVASLKKAIASGTAPKKKQGGIEKTWASQKPAGNVDVHNILETSDYNKATEEYKLLCRTLNNGEFKDALNICWRNSTQTGCKRKSCKQNHQSQIPKAIIPKWKHGELIAAAYGGFKSVPCRHLPTDVTALVTALKKKLDKAETDAQGAAGEDSPAPNPVKKANGTKSPSRPVADIDTEPATNDPLPMGDRTASLLLVRPQICSTEWTPSNQVLHLGSDHIKVNYERDWSCTFPGRLGSDAVKFGSKEKDLGQNLAGENNRCMVLTDGAVTDCAPTNLLKGYRKDCRLLREHLPDGHNSVIKFHLDLFEMDIEGSMPDNKELTSDLLLRSQPLSYHHSQILEQEGARDRATVIVEETVSCEADKIKRPSVSFICLVGSKASPSSIVKFRKIENAHATFLDEAYYQIGDTARVYFKTLADFIQFCRPIEPICRCSYKPCVSIQDTVTDFEGVTWPTFLPASQLGATTEFDLDYGTVGGQSNNTQSSMLIKFRHASALRNPDKISLDEFIYYIEDEVADLQKLAKAKDWSQMDLKHFDWYCFPVDDTRRKMYAIWEQDAMELEINEPFMTQFRLAFALVLRSWGFEANGSKCSKQTLDEGGCGKWNGNYIRLYKLGRSAWLLNQQTELLSAQEAALQLCPHGTFKALGHDLSHFHSFSLQDSEPVKKGGANLSIDQQLIQLAVRYNQQITLASTDTSHYVDNKEWFEEQAAIMTDLVVCIDAKFEQDHLKMLVRYARIYNPDASGPAADANRIQRLLVDNPAVQLESVLARRLITSHRHGVPAEMECSRNFRESVVNPDENTEFAELICRASRKLIIKGMKLFFPEACIPIISKWKGILLSPNLIVFTEKKPEGRICQAMSANQGDAPNDLMLDHNLIPCAYDHALNATRAVYSMKDELEAICEMVPGWESDKRLMQMSFLSMAYVDDFHVVSHDTANIQGGGTDLKQAFNWTNLNEEAVGIIATRLEIPEDWSKAMSNSCVIVWLVLNFGWIHSPPHHQPVPLAVRNAVNNTCTNDLLTSLPGYKFKPTDLSHLAMEALFRYIRYTVGYVETIDFDKTQDIESKLHRLGCTMFLDTLEIAVKESHLQRAMAAIEQGNEFERAGLKGVPLGWLQTTLGQFRFAAVMPKSWIMGFIVPLLRCLKGVRSDAPSTTLCYPSLPFQSDAVSLDNMHRCRRTLLVILKLMLLNPQCARLPMYLLLPPSEVIQRAPSERVIFCGHDACDQGLATLVWDPDEEGVIRALIVGFSPELRRLLHNSRHAELRRHPKDFLCMGNLEHGCITANMLQFPEKYNHKLALQISDNQPTVGCTNKGFGSNFVDQEMCRLESLMLVEHTSQQMTIWVQTWLNELLDALSRMYVDGVLQQSVMENIATISKKLGISLKFEAPNADVTTFLQWLASDKRDQLSLVDRMESSILSRKSNTASNLQNLAPKKTGGSQSLEEQPILSKLASGAGSMSVLDIANASSDLVNDALTTGRAPLLAAHICCGFGGMSIGSILAGFIPILNVENNPAAITFHESLTAGLICCGDLDDLDLKSLPRVHNMTVGFPCPPHTCLGRRKGWDDSRCRVRAVVDLILATQPYSVFGECVPGLLTSCNGEVFKYIMDRLSPLYHIHTEVMKFALFDHRSNRRRLIMAMLLKSIVTEPDFSTFPHGHISDLADVGPVSDCLIDTSDVPESLYVSAQCTPLPASNSPNGRLVYTHSMDGIKGAGTPKCPSAVFDSRGLAPTQLATVFANEEEFGVNTGLTFRTKPSFCNVLPTERPSKLTTQEQVNISNFPHDTVETALALGLSENQVSAGVNNAVPPSVCYPIALWFEATLLAALSSNEIVQTNKHAPHCGLEKAQKWVTSNSKVSKSGARNSPATMVEQKQAALNLAYEQFRKGPSTATRDTVLEARHIIRELTLDITSAVARLNSSAAIICKLHFLTEWRIGMNLSRVHTALTALTTENNLFCMTSPHGRRRPLASPPRLTASPTNLKATAHSILEQGTLSPGKIAILPPDLMVELATELAGATNNELPARIKVQYWLNNPHEAEASGNDWTVAEDCDLLTTQLVDAWSMMQAQAPAQRDGLLLTPPPQEFQPRNCFAAPQLMPPLAQADGRSNLVPTSNWSLEADLKLIEIRRTSELKDWAARIAWQQVMLNLPLLVFRYITPNINKACLVVKQDAIDLLSEAAEQFLQPLVDLAILRLPNSSPTPRLLSPSLLSLLDHPDLTPFMMNKLHTFPPLSSRAQLREADDGTLGKICDEMAYMDTGEFYFSRTGRATVYYHSEPETKPLLKPRLIDDCRSSMVSLTSHSINKFKASLAGVCTLSSRAVVAAITASPTRERIMKMCSKPPVTMMNRLMYRDTLDSLSLWATRTRCAQMVLAALTCDVAEAAVENTAALAEAVVENSAVAAEAAVENTAALVALAETAVASSPPAPVPDPNPLPDRQQIPFSCLNSVETSIPTGSVETSITTGSVETSIPRHCALLIAIVRNQFSALVSMSLARWYQRADTLTMIQPTPSVSVQPKASNITRKAVARSIPSPEKAPPMQQSPIVRNVSYLSEERQVLREFFDTRLGKPGEHMYLTSSAVRSLPRGTYNPCDPSFRDVDFDLRIPMKRKTGPDIAVGDLTRLLPDRPELHHVQICTRSPMAAHLARALLKKAITITLPSPTKAGGWDNIPATSIVYRPLHPTKNGRRPTLGKPDQAEIDAENEFESEVMGASLGGATEGKYKGWMQQFVEYLSRHTVELLVETNTNADAKAALTNLRYWARRFFLNEGAVRGLQYSSINCKAYAIRWHYLITYGLDVLAGWVEHKIFMRGLKRIRHNPQRKCPVSWALLMWLVRQLSDSARDKVVKAAILVGWWFLCRISEILSFRLGSIRFFDNTGNLLDIQTANLDTATEVDLMFAVTKNDVDGDGAIRTHARVPSRICVVSALAQMVTARRAANKSGIELDLMSPLFGFFDSTKDSGSERSITRATVVRVLKAAAAAANIPKARVSCHSLRSGGAVAMLSVSGCSYSDVRLFGRWRSDCCRLYLRAVRGMMAEVSARMAANSTDCTVMMAGGSRQKRY